MIKLKTKEEIKILREGGQKLAAILDELAGRVCPGLTTGELEAKACELIKKAGGRPSFKNRRMFDGRIFPTSLCIAINNEVVHGPSLPSRSLNDGDIIGIDIGMIYPFPNNSEPRNKYLDHGGYFTDMAKTAIVGEVEENVKKLVNVTQKCLYAGIKQVKPGNTINNIGTAIQSLAESQGFSIVRELLGHGVGHDFHEEPQVPNFRIKDTGLNNVVLKPGLVIAIEPMVNMGGWKTKILDDGFTVATADGSLSAHFEHTVAVTEDGHIILTEL